ncbi:hypothetical protein ACFQ3P_40875 [Paraburkholderia sabiae]|uniref:Uncharacterized protein n=1 Tax=Paraburkholderia sabiae TaxID=273251 RepID=A0ABU9QLX0_9BURK|nr:hypothetical protein [Paraburkholderia sabiae]WJZ77285.1 hypothetical protein QEN71_35005 [Paraburkholderia sabiae]
MTAQRIDMTRAFPPWFMNIDHETRSREARQPEGRNGGNRAGDGDGAGHGDDGSLLPPCGAVPLLTQAGLGRRLALSMCLVSVISALLAFFALSFMHGQCHRRTSPAATSSVPPSATSSVPTSVMSSVTISSPKSSPVPCPGQLRPVPAQCQVAGSR